MVRSVTFPCATSRPAFSKSTRRNNWGFETEAVSGWTGEQSSAWIIASLLCPLLRFKVVKSLVTVIDIQIKCFPNLGDHRGIIYERLWDIIPLFMIIVVLCNLGQAGISVRINFTVILKSSCSQGFLTPIFPVLERGRTVQRPVSSSGRMDTNLNGPTSFEGPSFLLP